MYRKFGKRWTSPQTKAAPAEATANTRVPEVEQGATPEDKELQQREYKTWSLTQHLVLTVFNVYVKTQVSWNDGQEIKPSTKH